MRRFTIITALVLAGCATMSTQSNTTRSLEGEDGGPDSSLGLSRTSVFEVPEPDSFVYATTEPGESDVLERSFEGAPPQISHEVDAYLPITVMENACAGCHQNDDRSQLPDSHFTDLRNDPDGGPGDFVAGARWRCMACHVPQSGAKQLVGSVF